MTSPVPLPRFGLADRFPEMGEIEARAARDLPGALALVAERRALGAEEHAAAVDALVEVQGIGDALDAHLRTHPEDREARTVRAARVVRHAWGVRGTEPGHVVGPERFATFFGLLGQAERDLLRLVAEDPADVTAWTLRLSTARGLALGPSESRRRWSRLRAVAAHDVAAQREYLQHLTPKWGGDWRRVDAHVAAVTAAADAGSAEWSIVPFAHLTRWFDDHRAEGTDYLRSPEVVEAVEAAEERFVAAPCPSRVRAVTAHTDFAVALGLAGRRGRAAAHFASLGPALDPEVWALGADHVTDLENIRASALAEGRRR